MKRGISVLISLLSVVGFTVFGQAEYDDMYFNSSDRVSTIDNQLAFNKKPAVSALEAETVATINPTDYYTGRTVNPEYIDRSQLNGVASASDLAYFIPNYSPTAINQTINQDSYSSGNYYSPYYGNNYNNPYSNMNNPYAYSPYGSNSSLWNMSMGMGYGGYYGGGFYGMNNYNSMFGMSNMFCPGMGGMYYGNPYGNYYANNPYNYGGVVIDTRAVQSNYYGNRPSRSSTLNNVVDANGPVVYTTRSGRSVSSQSGRSEGGSVYYDREWKRNPDVNPTRSYWNGTTTSGTSSVSHPRLTNHNNTGTRNYSGSFWDTGNSSGRSAGSSMSSGSRSSISSGSSGRSSGSSSGSSGRGRGNN